MNKVIFPLFMLCLRLSEWSDIFTFKTLLEVKWMKWYCRLFSLLYFSLDISIILIHWKNTHKLNQDKKSIVISMNDIRTNVEGSNKCKRERNSSKHSFKYEQITWQMINSTDARTIQHKRESEHTTWECNVHTEKWESRWTRIFRVVEIRKQ